jgi:hypothetical protein
MSPVSELLMVNMSTSEHSCYKIKLLSNLCILSVARDEKTY